MKIFDLIKNNSKSNTSNLIDTIKRNFRVHGNPLNQVNVNQMFSMESMAESEMSVAKSGIESLRNTFIDSMQEVNLTGYSEEQLNAGLMAATACANPAAVRNRTKRQHFTSEGDRVIDTYQFGGGELDVGRIADLNISTEAYDETETRNTMIISYAYNLKAARQDQFGEAFFETVAIAPDVATVTVVCDLLSVFEEQTRNIDGTFNYEFNRKSVFNGIVYPNILNNETNRLYPVFRNGDAENNANFVATTDIAPYPVELENKQAVQTAPLRVGREFDLIGLSAPDHLLNRGALDFTDQLDPSVRLGSFYIKMSDGKILQIADLEVQPESNFTYSVNGGQRHMNLNFEYRDVFIDENFKLYDGTDLSGTVIGTANLTVRLEARLNGKVDLNIGRISVNAGEIIIRNVYDANKQTLDLTQGVGKQAADLFKDARVIGYDVISYLSNTNHRQRGQILDLNRERNVYSIPTLAPVSIVCRTGEDEADDGERINSLVATTYIRCSNAAVRTLIATSKRLAALPDDLDPELVYRSQALGASRFFVIKHYEERTIDVVDQIATLRSNDRIVDVQAVLVNHIRDMVYAAHLKSNYKQVVNALYGDNGDKKPMVIIGTDPYTASYLQVTGDIRTLSDEFDFQVVTTPNILIRDTIYISFGKMKGMGNSLNNPVQFGNMYWRPEITSVLQVSRQDQVSKEITAQPSFTHVPHLPIMMVLHVKNLRQAVTTMAPINIKTV